MCGLMMLNMWLQNCAEVLESLHCGDFGQVTQETINDYRTQCHMIFPYTNAFMLDLPNGTVDETLGDGDIATAAGVAADTDCIDCIA